MCICIYIFIRDVSVCVCMWVCVRFLFNNFWLLWCYSLFLFRSFPSQSVALSFVIASLSIYLTVSHNSLAQLVTVSVSVSVLRITFYFLVFCLSINLQYAFYCWWRCLSYFSLLFSLLPLPPSLPAPPAHANVKKSFIHTDGIKITHTVCVQAKRTYCAPFTTVCCFCYFFFFCPFVRPFVVCRFLRLPLFLSFSQASKCCEFCWFIFVQLVRILFAFFPPHICMCMFVCISVIVQNLCRVYAF